MALNLFSKNSEREPGSQTLKEIFSQPAVLRRVLGAYLDKTDEVVFPSLAKVAAKLTQAKSIVFIGCGSSYFAGLFAAYAFEEIAGIEAQAEMADELTPRHFVLSPQPAVVAISQSGQTAGVLAAVEEARKHQAVSVIALVNRPGSKLEALVETTVLLRAGEEKAIAATKTFTASLTLLLLLAVFFARLHRRSEAKIRLLLRELASLPAQIEEVLAQERKIKKIARDYANQDRFFILGESFNYPIALEAALKFKEMAYIQAEAVASGEFRHGPMAVIEKKFPCLVIAPPDSAYHTNTTLVKLIKEKGAWPIVLTARGHKGFKPWAREELFLPPAAEMVYPLLVAVALQLLAYHLGVLRLIDVDHPRYLNKFVG